ncbi:MAG: hypothetical protein K1X89_16555 [Myxococcaceae bacterium]|nr:hypothetical protein [Myxococcaceae bacterium]
MVRNCLVGCLVALAACTDASSKLQDKQKALDDAKAKEAARKDAAKPKAPVVEAAKLGPPWEDPSYVELRSERPCPEGFWALFPDTPGDTKEEKKANAAKRPELVKALRGKTFLVRLYAPRVNLKDYDAPKGAFPLEVEGTIDCTDSFGRVAVAWTQAKAGDPGNSAAKEGAEITQNMWLAPPVAFSLPMKSMAEAKEFASKHKMGLAARVVFTLGKAEVDHKLKKIGKVVEKAAGETLTIGGGVEDWGAGRLVRADLKALRVSIENEKTPLIEQKE